MHDAYSGVKSNVVQHLCPLRCFLALALLLWDSGTLRLGLLFFLIFKLCLTFLTTENLSWKPFLGALVANWRKIRYGWKILLFHEFSSQRLTDYSSLSGFFQNRFFALSPGWLQLSAGISFIPKGAIIASKSWQDLILPFVFYYIR